VNILRTPFVDFLFGKFTNLSSCVGKAGTQLILAANAIHATGCSQPTAINGEPVGLDCISGCEAYAEVVCTFVSTLASTLVFPGK